MKNTSPDRVAIEEGIIVGSGGSRELKCDVYVPPAGRANGLGVLVVHGGAWIRGDRTQLSGYGTLLGRVGYTCVACEYRLSGDATWPAQIDDVRTAFDWMRAHASDLEIDGERIAVQGNSAGGHLALMLAAEGNTAACLAIYPPTDLVLRSAAAERRRAENPDANVVDVTARLLGGRDSERQQQASPVNHVTDAFPPTMLIHGNADEVVDVEHSLRMYRALIDGGAKGELHIFDGVGHEFDRDPALGRQCASLMTLFLDRHVKSRATSGAR